MHKRYEANKNKQNVCRSETVLQVVSDVAVYRQKQQQKQAGYRLVDPEQRSEVLRRIRNGDEVRISRVHERPEHDLQYKWNILNIYVGNRDENWKQDAQAASGEVGASKSPVPRADFMMALSKIRCWFVDYDADQRGAEERAKVAETEHDHVEVDVVDRDAFVSAYALVRVDVVHEVFGNSRQVEVVTQLQQSEVQHAKPVADVF